MNVDREIGQLKREVAKLRKEQRQLESGLAQLDYALRQLDGGLGQLSTELEERGGELDRLLQDVNQLGNLRYDISQLENQLTSMRWQIGQLEDGLEEARGDFAKQASEISSTLHHLTNRIRGLERRIRSASAGAITDLDAADPEIQQWAAEADRGRQAKATFLTDEERQARQTTIQHYEQARQQRAAHLQEALAAISKLSSAVIGDQSFVIARTTYTAAVPKLRNAAEMIRRLNGPARDARKELDSDNDRRKTANPTIVAADEAWSNLRARLDRRISEALDRGDVMPYWFDTVLNLAPPAQKADEWLDRAVEVLAYRITYGITDPARPLGLPPPEDAPSHRVDWGRELERQLSLLHS
jgi:chromosome segregation ATPase